MIIKLLVGQLFLALFNIGNSHFDAYRILHNKTIAHGLNFVAYLLFVVLLCFLLSIPGKFLPLLLFFSAAFFNRQFSFDIPLNLRRGLDWYYQSQDNPPKSITDRLERWLFGNGPQVGKKIFKAYLIIYCIIITLWILVVHTN